MAVLAHAEDASTQQKRAAPDYTYRSAGPQYNQDSAGSPAYSKSLQAVLAKSGPSLQQEYISQQPAAPGLSQAQQYYQEQVEPQAVAYAQPTSNKYISASAGAGSASPAEAQKVSVV